jgi:hypothetical protein
MKKLLIDILIVTASVILAIYLSYSGGLQYLFDLVGDNLVIASVLTGLFFTSFFTTPLAIAMFANIAHQGNIFLIALLGGLGAVVGDSILFFFVRDRVVKDSAFLMSGPRWKRILRIFKKRRFRRILPIVGAIIIASPLPDELGLALLGVSTLSRPQFFLLSFAMNSLGIFIILLVAQI